MCPAYFLFLFFSSLWEMYGFMLTLKEKRNYKIVFTVLQKSLTHQQSQRVHYAKQYEIAWIDYVQP